MRLLAIDTSTASTVVAVADGTRLAGARHDPVGRERPAHTTAALDLARTCLGELALDWTDLDRIGAGIGPGSFTGLRSGLSAAAGLARRLALPLVGLPATELLARGAVPVAAGSVPGAAALPRSVLAVVDGRRGELFVQAFPGSADDAVTPWSARPRVLARDELGGPGGPEVAGWLVVGDGARLERDAFLALGGDVPERGDARHAIASQALAALTAEGVPQPANEVRPAYGRGADAVPTSDRPAKPIPGGREHA